MLHDFTENTTVSTTDNEDLLGVGVGHHGKVCDHLLVPIPLQNQTSVFFVANSRFAAHDVDVYIRELVALSALDNIVEDKDGAVVAALKDHDILVLRFLVVEDLVDPEVHGLAGPHLTDFREPAI